MILGHMGIGMGGHERAKAFRAAALVRAPEGCNIEAVCPTPA